LDSQYEKILFDNIMWIGFFHKIFKCGTIIIKNILIEILKNLEH
jgi:hypothetical protein